MCIFELIPPLQLSVSYENFTILCKCAEHTVFDATHEFMFVISISRFVPNAVNGRARESFYLQKLLNIVRE